MVHWSHTYSIDIDGVKKHDVKMHIVSEKAILLETTENFGKAFGKYLQENDCGWSKNTKFDDGSVRSGWLFSSETKSQERIISLLRRIHVGSVPPIMNSFSHSKDSEEMKKMCNSIYSNLEKIFSSMPEEKDTYTLSSDGGETIFYFNREDMDDTKGECVVRLEKSRKKLEIYQYIHL
jgi:hypothetical protein